MNVPLVFWANLAALRKLLVLIAVVACAAEGYSQAWVPGMSAGGQIRLRQTDVAVLELQQPRSDLSCAVTALKPDLGFDFMFHAGYEVHVPIRQLAGRENELTVVFRVVPQDHPEDPSYMVQKMSIPALGEGSKGAGTFSGMFTLGDGRYHVDWMMRDRQERICATSWDLEAKLNSKDRQLSQWIPHALAQPPEPIFAPVPPMIRTPEDSSPRISFIVNVDPPDSSAAAIDNADLSDLMAILRRIGRDPRIRPFSIFVVSMETQHVIYRQENESTLDLPALGEALGLLKLGIVDAKRLVSTPGPTQFATDLVREQLVKENLDALVVLGSKKAWETTVSRTALKSFDPLGKPAFYLSYSAKQQWSVLQDPISSIMKHLRGFEYRINRPKDLFNAWSDVVSRIVRAKWGPQASAATSVAH